MTGFRRGTKRARGLDLSESQVGRPNRVFLVETSEGDFRDATPAKITRQLHGCDAIQEHTMKRRRSDSGDETKKSSSPIAKDLTILEKMQMGIQIGLRNERTQKNPIATSLANAVWSSDDNRFALDGLAAQATTVADAQRAILHRLGFDGNQKRTQDMQGIEETNGQSEMIHPDMTRSGADERQFHNFEHYTFRGPHM